MTQPYEIRLVVDHMENTYKARWIEPGGQESEPFSLALPLKKDDTDELRWYLEEYHQFPGTGDRARAGGVEEKLKDWGRTLFDAVFDTSEGTHVYRTLMDEAKREPCLLTLGATEPDILSLPWEMMRDRRGPLAFQGVTIRRQLRGSGRPRRLNLSLPLRVLLIVSRPKDTGFIDPRNSIAPLLEALEALPRGQAAVDFCEPPTLAQLEEIISQARKRKRPYHIVHFDGHGTYLAHTGIGALAFEYDNNSTHLVTATELGDLLARLDVPLVMLEACRSSDLSDKPVFGSVAPALLESGVGSVVAFSHSVHIKAAHLLVERFYHELAEGLTIGQALDEARVRLRSDPKRWLHLGPDADSINLQDWFIPQLYQIGPDLALVTEHDGEPDSEEISKHRVLKKDPPLHGFPPPPLYHFHGRAMELLEMERAFRRYPALLVSGMGGMGKTALAREAASWWLRTARFEKAVFCSFEQRAGAERVVQLIGQALEGDSFSTRSSDEQWTEAVDLFHSQPVIVVWDNFESTLPIYQREEPQAPGLDKADLAESPLAFGSDARSRLMKLYRDLTRNSPKGRLMITCRPAETGLPGLKEIPLKGLTQHDSLHLMAAVMDLKSISIKDKTGKEKTGYERAEINKLLKAIDNHPLSLELITPHLRTLTPAKIRAEFLQLLDRFADETAYEARNRSLLASLEFSKKHLSEAAQKALPYLAWFERGVFEQFLLDFTELTPETWDSIRAELTATALVSVEEERLLIGNRPYLRFHPTLPYAARPTDVPDVNTAEERFISLYQGVSQIADNALRGSQPGAGMSLMTLEEANIRAAITRAFNRGMRYEAWSMANTLALYLERAGRLREWDALVKWVHQNLPVHEGLDNASCEAIRQHAWALFTQGKADEAIQMVQDLINRLNSEGLADGQDPAFQFAMSYLYLGRIYLHANRPHLALEPLQKAISGFEKLGHAQRDNLSAALGDLAGTYGKLGQFNEALKTAKRALDIDRDLGRDREIATGLGQIARILTMQQRYTEADTRYTEALSAARAADDLGLQGITLQHQGSLQDDMGNYDRAVELYKQAIDLFQRAADSASEMRTCDLIATAERKRGHLEAAQAWYGRSRELAEQLNDRAQLAATAQNVGILYQTQAEQTSDPETRTALLHQAAASVKESLAINLEMQNQVSAALSYGQLGVLHRMLGNLDEAEKNTLEALKIHESLNLPDVYKDYLNLANIARDRGNKEAAAQWQAKYEAKWEEVERLRRGEGGQGSDIPGQLAQLILALAQAAYTARMSKTRLDPEAAEALAQMAEMPPPLNMIGTFLQEVAQGKPVPKVPEGMPQEVVEILNKLVEEIRK